MHLSNEVIQRADITAVRQQLISYVSSYKSCPSGNKNSFLHIRIIKTNSTFTLLRSAVVGQRVFDISRSIYIG